jgi:hypothetical protein
MTVVGEGREEKKREVGEKESETYAMGQALDLEIREFVCLFSTSM